MPVRNQFRVAVVGAGISGLACARALESRGAAVTVFDKGAAPGGRFATRDRDGRRFDHGAQYFTVRHPRFERAVITWRDVGLVESWTGRIVRIDANGSMTNARSAERFVGTPSMRALPEYLSAGSAVLQGVRITSVRRVRDRWELDDDDGRGHGPFDVVVVAVPAAQAAGLLYDAPALAREARHVTMDPCWAVMVEFGGPLQRRYDAAFLEGGALSWVARDSSKPGRDGAERWVLHAGPTWSRVHLEQSPALVAHRLLQEFLGLGPGDAHATHVRAHRWRYAQPAVPLLPRCLFDPALGVGVCGDWCGGPRVEGAFLSGVAVADHVLLSRPAVAA